MGEITLKYPLETHHNVEDIGKILLFEARFLEIEAGTPLQFRYFAVTTGKLCNYSYIIEMNR